MKRARGTRGEYRAFAVVMLDGPDFRRLSADARLTLFVTKLSLGASGIQAVPGWLGQLADRTGLSPERQRAAWEELEREGWAYYDTMVAWLVRGLEHEYLLDATNTPQRTGIQRHVVSLPRTALVGCFVTRYAAWFGDGAPTVGPWAAPDERTRDWLTAHGVALTSPREAPTGSPATPTVMAPAGAIEGPTKAPVMALEGGVEALSQAGERREEKGEEHHTITARAREDLVVLGRRQAEELLSAVTHDLAAREFLSSFERVLRETGDVLATTQTIAGMRSGMHGPGGRAVPLVAIGKGLADMLQRKVPISTDNIQTWGATALRQLDARERNALSPTPRAGKPRPAATVSVPRL